MSQDQITETSTQSWISRIGGSFVGFLFGLVIILCAIALFAWNEARAVTAANSLKRGLGSVVEIVINQVNATNNNKLVYASGTLTSNAGVSDPALGISESKSVRMRREVQMYQWVEAISCSDRDLI